MSVSFTAESYFIQKERKQIVPSFETVNETRPEDDPVGFNHVEVELISIDNLPFADVSSAHEIFLLLKGPQGDYPTPAVMSSGSSVACNHQVVIDLKKETQPNLEIVVLERKNTNTEELCKWEGALNLICKPDEWSSFNEAMTCNSKHTRKHNAAPTLNVKLRLARVKSGRRLLPGQVKFSLDYDLEKDLKKSQQEYSEKFASLIKQEFEKTSVEDKGGNDAVELSILQFNMLADALCTAYTEGDSLKEFIGVDKECLRWSYRGLRIAELLLQHNTDIICLEECDQSEFLSRYLSSTYECLHQPKIKAPARHILTQLQEERKDSLPPDFKLNNDGIFIAFKKDKFEKVGDEIKIRDDQNEEKVVALAVRLRQKGKDKNSEFMVIGTHLKSEKSEQGEKVRQKQIQYLLGRFLDVNLPIILACDLNANPIVNKKGYDPLCYAEVKKFGLESVYVKGQGKEPEFTTYKKRPEAADKHTIDYIFIKADNWIVTELLQIKERLEMNADYSVIPNWNYPSDHFAIGCRLRWGGDNATAGTKCNCSIM